MAAALGMSGHRTLVVDLDPQGFLTRMVGLSEPAEKSSSLMLFDPDSNLCDIPCQSRKSFDVIPASSLLSKYMRKLNKPTDVFWVKEALEKPHDYDVVMFDTAAAITVFSLNALVASEFVIIPVMPEYQPILGGEQTFQTAMMVREKLNPVLHEPRFLFTMVDARKRNHHAYRHYLRNRYEERVMESIIRTSTALSVTHEKGSTVFDHDPYSRGARDYANATDELLHWMDPVPQDIPEPQTDQSSWRSITNLS